MSDETRVDVLAVMDRERSCALGVDGYSQDDYQNALSARAAVAELIDSCEYLSARSTAAEWTRFHTAISTIRSTP